MSATARLAFPFLEVGQAQKELWHNEALQRLDIVVAAAVEEAPRATPPATPTEGACYLVANSPTGAWMGYANHLAGWSSGGWRLIAPAEGTSAYVRSASVWAVFRAGAWELGTVRGTNLTLAGKQVVGSRLPAIATPSGGSTVDGQSRTAISEILNALRQHGLIEP
jgi:hypothetical protein